MKSKIMAKILLISLVLTNFYGCSNKPKDKKTIDYNAPYYTISIYSYEKLRNEYIDIDIKIPKIIDTSSKSDAFIQTVNSQIEMDIKKIIDNKKAKAKNEYDTYMQSFREEMKSKFREGFHASYSNVDKFPNWKYDDEKKENNNFKRNRASTSNINKWPNRNSFGNNENKKMPDELQNEVQQGTNNFNNNSETVTGFTNSNELIIPGLHNKNIIVVETTTKVKNETTIKDETSIKRVVPSENGDLSSFGNRNNNSNSNNNFTKRVKRSSMSNTDKRNFSPQNNQASDNQIQIIQTNQYIEQSTNKIEKPNVYQDDLKIVEQSEKNSTYDEKDLVTNRNLLTPYTRTLVTCDYIITCLDNEYISINVSVNTYGTQTEIKNLFYNIDLKNKKILTLKDMLGEEYKEDTTNSSFFINTNHIPIILNEDGSLTAVSKGK